MRKLINQIALGIAIPLVGLFLWIGYSSIYNYLHEQKYVELLSNTPGVESVPFYINYEGTRMARLNLDNGGLLHISRFEENNKDKIAVDVIGNIEFVCSDKANRTTFLLDGPNIIGYLRQSKSGIGVRNIGDLVAKYDKIYQFVFKAISHDNNHPTVINDGSSALWCSVVKYPTNPRSPMNVTRGENPATDTLRNLASSNALPQPYNRAP